MKLTILAILLISVVASSNAYYINVKTLTKRANYYRRKPKAMANFIKKNYLGANGVNCSTGIHAKWRLKFRENCVAVNAAIARLRKQKACPIFKLDEGLNKISYDQAAYNVKINTMTHTGPKGKEGLGERIKLFNHFRTRIAENIITAREGISASANLILANWIIDDGVSSRGHYHNFYNCEFDTWGVGVKSLIQNGKKVDWVVTFFAAQASCCYKCPMSASVRREMGWSKIPAKWIAPKC